MKHFVTRFVAIAMVALALGPASAQEPAPYGAASAAD
jgi:hypothetical protein